jgi:hypothetical protein
LAISGEKTPVAQFFWATDLATRPTHLNIWLHCKLSVNRCFWRQGPFTPILFGEMP